MPDTALVTGAGRRIGRAIAEDLAAHGWRLAIHCLTAIDEANQLADNIAENGGKAAVLVGDLADPMQSAELIDEAKAALGPVTLLVNSASMFEPDMIGDLDQDLWRRQIDINLSSPVFLADAFARQMPDGRDGNIINLLDQRVWKLTPAYFSYMLSKSALWTATQTMAQALAPRIRVNAIGPGPALRSVNQSAEGFQRQVDSVLLQRGPDMAEITGTIRYILDTPSMTGQMIALDGGQHLAWQTPDVADGMD